MGNVYTHAIAEYLDKYDVSGYEEYDFYSGRYIVHVILSDGNKTEWFIPAKYVEDPCCDKVNFFLKSIVNAYY